MDDTEMTKREAMSDDEHITDELRKWLDHYTMRKDTYDEMIAIVDRIDAEHERQLEVLYWDMGDADYIKLPKDADGESIHVGDVMESEKIGGGFCEPFEVIGYIMSNGELEPMDEHKCPRKRKYLHHHKQPTVEDLLRDMNAKLDEVTDLYVGEVIDSDERDSDEARIFAEYAAKLRLADDAE